MLELLTIFVLFAGLCVALYFTIKIFPVDLDIDDRLEETESLVTADHSK